MYWPVDDKLQGMLVLRKREQNAAKLEKEWGQGERFGQLVSLVLERAQVVQTVGVQLALRKQVQNAVKLEKEWAQGEHFVPLVLERAQVVETVGVQLVKLAIGPLEVQTALDVE